MGSLSLASGAKAIVRTVVSWGRTTAELRSASSVLTGTRFTGAGLSLHALTSKLGDVEPASSQLKYSPTSSALFVVGAVMEVIAARPASSNVSKKL